MPRKYKPRTPEQREKNREYMRQRRLKAKEDGVVLPSDTWQQNNREKVNKKARLWRKANPEKRREAERRYAEKNPEKIKAKNRKQKERRKALGIKNERTPEQLEKNRQYMKKRREEAKECGIALPSDAWWKENIEKHREKTRRWRDKNPEKSRERARVSQKKRRSTKWGLITNRFYGVLQIELRHCSPWHSRNSKYLKPLGYSFYDLYQHIEKQFEPGMSWENWGEWHIDHIKPLRLFKYESLDDPLFKEAWALSNLRPLWKKENLMKSGKWEEDVTY